jgi:UDP-N-acetylmuramate dehydrogenase
MKTPSVQNDVPLQGLNTLAVSSTAEYFSVLETAADLPGLLALARHSKWSVRVLGEGSNVVLGERLDGLLIQQCCRGISVVEEDAETVDVAVAAGENWHGFVRWCLQQGYYGLENLALIPGTVGAAPIQNIGAYGVEVGVFLRSVQCRRLAQGETLTLSQAECEFDYRDSVIKRSLRDQLMVESVRFRLRKIPQPDISYPALAQWLEQHQLDAPTPEQVFEAVMSIRRSRLPDPSRVPNAGSFFKNPRVDGGALQALLEKHPALPHYRDQSAAAPVDSYKLAAAWLIDYCGFRRRALAPVRVHPEHALVLINPERASALEIGQLATEIVASVEAEFGLQLEQEPRSYGL